MSVNHQILETAIKHWNIHFTGISASSIAKKLDLPHDSVIQVFDELESNALGILRKDTPLYSSKPNSDNDGSCFEEIRTSIFFPSKHTLVDYFHTSGLARKNLPKFRARLHQGDCQITPFYFSTAVLEKYLDRPELYKVTDSIEGGSIRMRSNVADQYTDEELDVRWISNMRFGKRNLLSGEIVTTAILWDLSELPNSEQSHWHSCEIKNAEFAEIDPEYERYVKRDFDAEWVEGQDPLRSVKNLIDEINLLFQQGDLFRKASNPYLAYPVSNTYKSFYDCCSELYKLVSPDNLNQKLIKQILSEVYHYGDDDFIHQESGRNLSPLQLLKELSTKIPEAQSISDSIKNVSDYRVEADHKITKAQKHEVNLIRKFSTLCEQLAKSLADFYTGLSSVLIQKGAQ